MLHAPSFAHKLSDFHFQRLTRRHLRTEIVGYGKRTPSGKTDNYPSETPPCFSVQTIGIRALSGSFGLIRPNSA